MVNGGHVYHLIHFLLHEWKLGGALALVGAAAWTIFLVDDPVTVQSSCIMLRDGTQACAHTAPDWEGVMAHLEGAVVGGAIGAAVGFVLTLLGASKEDLGIPDE